MAELYQLREMKEILAKYQFFQECIVEGFESAHFGASVAFTLNYIWDTEGKVRSNLDDKKLVQVEFGLVQEFRLEGALTQAMVESPEHINWGLSDMAQLTIDNDNHRLKRYSSLPARFYHAEFRWEDARHIDIIFSGLEISKKDSEAVK